MHIMTSCAGGNADCVFLAFGETHQLRSVKLIVHWIRCINVIKIIFANDSENCFQGTYINEASKYINLGKKVGKTNAFGFIGVMFIANI